MTRYYDRYHPHRIPVRVVDPYQRSAPTELKPLAAKQQAHGDPPAASAKSQATPERQPAPFATEPMETTEPAATNWEAVARQQQAEMDNFRQRQRRLAAEAANAERERLLRLILPALDNLERALNQPDHSEDALRQGINLTHRELLRVLQAEGVTRLNTVGQEFDPHWHEALATVAGQAAPNVIVDEIEAGYRLGDKLLRPAKVVVAA